MKLRRWTEADIITVLTVGIGGGLIVATLIILRGC